MREFLNFFETRLTNASAESFNAKLKYLRVTFRGIADPKFFLFRTTGYLLNMLNPQE